MNKGHILIYCASYRAFFQVFLWLNVKEKNGKSPIFYYLFLSSSTQKQKLIDSLKLIRFQVVCFLLFMHFLPL